MRGLYWMRRMRHWIEKQIRAGTLLRYVLDENTPGGSLLGTFGRRILSEID